MQQLDLSHWASNIYIYTFTWFQDDLQDICPQPHAGMAAKGVSTGDSAAHIGLDKAFSLS